MQLSEKIILRRYNALANDWTPLSRKPCWLSIAFHCLRDYVKRNRFSWFHRLVTSLKNYPTHHMLHLVGDKSFADDLVASGYCKCESNLCVTIHWDFCRVPSICSSLIQLTKRLRLRHMRSPVVFVFRLRDLCLELRADSSISSAILNSRTHPATPSLLIFSMRFYWPKTLRVESSPNVHLKTKQKRCPSTYLTYKKRHGVQARIASPRLRFRYSVYCDVCFFITQSTNQLFIQTTVYNVR